MEPRLPLSRRSNRHPGAIAPIATFRPHKSRGTWSLSSGPPLPKQAGLICLNMNPQAPHHAKSCAPGAEYNYGFRQGSDFLA